MADTKPVFAADALSDFTANLAQQALGHGPYRDSPYQVSVSGIDSVYRSNWLARAAVDMIPDECFRKGYQWVADPEQIGLIEHIEKDMCIKQKKRSALSLSRLDGEAYLYMDTGSDPSDELILDRSGKGALRFVNLLRKNQVTKGQPVTDPMSSYFGQPEYYTVSGGSQSVSIHPSRMIRFTHRPDANTGEGVSVLTYMLQPIIAATTARDNMVAVTTEATIDIISVCGLMDTVRDPAEAAKVAERYALFRQAKETNKLGVLDKDGEEYVQHQRSLAGWPDTVESARREAAAALGIPHAILFGRPGGLGSNSEVELKAYYDNIAAMQENVIDPTCAVLDELLIRSALGSHPNEVFHNWISLYEMTEKEKAEIAKLYADAAGISIDKGILNPEVMSEPLVNSWTELGVFQGVEQSYQEMYEVLVDGG